MNSIGENWILVNRPTLPIVLNADIPDVGRIANRIASLDPAAGNPSVPGALPPGGVPFTSESGIGDVVHFSMLGQSIPQEKWGGGDFVWALGPTFQFPTASNSVISIVSVLDFGLMGRGALSS